MLVRDFENAMRRSIVGQWPRLTDLEKGNVFVSNEVLSAILSAIENNRYTVLIGAQARGKSTLAKVVGFKKLQKGEPVYILDCRSEGQSAEQIGTFMTNRDDHGPLWIIDDIQLAAEEIASLYDTIESCLSSRFLFVWRRTLPKNPSEITTDEDWLDEVLDTAAIFPLRPSLDIIEGIISTYLTAHQHETRFQEMGLGHTVLSEDYSWAMETTGGNLQRLTSYLEIWQPKTGPLRQLNRSMILQAIREQQLKPLFEQGEEILQTYVDVASVYQLEVPGWARIFPAVALDTLERQGLLEDHGKGFYGLAHASEARDVVEAFATMRGKTPAKVTEEAITRNLEADDVPKSHVLGLMKGLRELYVGHPTESLRKQFEQFVLQRPSWSGRAEYIRSFSRSSTEVRAFVKCLGETVVRDAVGHTRAAPLRNFLAAIRRVDSELADELESTLTIDDKIYLYSRVGLSSLARSLAFYMRQEKSRPFARRVLAGVANETFPNRVSRASISGCGRLMRIVVEIDERLAIELAIVVANHVSLAGADSAEKLSLLIKNLRFSEPACLRLVQRIVVECDPERFLAKGPLDKYSYLLNWVEEFRDKLVEPTAALKFFTGLLPYLNTKNLGELSARSLGALIWNFLRAGMPLNRQLLKFYPELSAKLRHAEPESTFWLLWSIFQTDELVYRRLVKELRNDLGRLLEEAPSLGSPELAIIGLLSHNGESLGVQNRPIQIKPIVETLLAQESASKILFALVGAQEIGDAQFSSMLTEMRARVGKLDELLTELIAKNRIEASRARLFELAKIIKEASALPSVPKTQPAQ
jgi:hypothetical protein